MSTNFGIIGLPQSGKTTIFNALTRGKADTAIHFGETTAPHIGIAHVPEPRLVKLNDIFHAPRLVYAEAKYIDVGASVKSLVKDKSGLSGQILNQLNNVDTLICVIRAFTDASVPHPQGNVDVKRDINDLTLEMAFSDLAAIERRLEKLDNTMKALKSGERSSYLQEKESLLVLKTELESGRPLRSVKLEPSIAKLLTSYQFLTLKPALVLVNIGEEQVPQATKLETELSQQFSDAGCRVIVMCGKLEMELSQLEEKTAQEFRKGYGLNESGLERTLRISNELSGLITFFTAGPNEVRAWQVQKGTTAPKAAGKIHSDMEKGFIRAECIRLNELLECGSMTEAKKRGLLRLEGKEYVIQDGDIITFLFNV